MIHTRHIFFLNVDPLHRMVGVGSTGKITLVYDPELLS